jgi:tetratricopeptide (TPR) repeat protein
MRWSWWLVWILAPAIIAVVTSFPWIVGAALLAVVVRRYLPDPIHWFQTAGRIGKLQRSVEVNPENVTASRDLAMLHLERNSPAKAISLLETALLREPKSAELHFFLGCGRLAAGKAKEAIVSLDEAIKLDERVRYGDAFLRRGDAHRQLGALDDAIASYEKFTTINGSSLEGLVKLSRARASKGDKAGAKSALAEARKTFRTLPAFRRKGQWRWYIAANALSVIG